MGTYTEIEETFKRLAGEYEKQTMLHSFAHMMTKAPAFGKLVDMGEPIVPLILKEFKKKKLGGVAWFIILEAITGTVPLKPDSICGTSFVKVDVQKTQDAWMQWGKEHGYTV